MEGSSGVSHTPAVESPDGQIVLELNTLGGRTISISLGTESTVKDLKELASVELGCQSGLLRIVGSSGDLNNSHACWRMHGQSLSVLLRGRECVPFDENKVPENSLVLVDGIPAIFDYYTSGGWGSSDKIRFQFNQGEHHPEFGQLFQTKDWTSNPRTGTVTFRGGGSVQVVHVLTSEEVSEAQQEAKGKSWQVVASSALVRSAMSLQSPEQGRLMQGDVLIVEEGCFLDDADRTPRLCISSPIRGWVTPFMSSSNRILIRPSPEARARYAQSPSVLRRISQMLAE